MPSAFISYVRDNSEQVDKLAGELRQHGVTVWLDREQIMPGMRWQDAIRQAITKGDYFIACFSAEYVVRPMTYMNTEIGLAIEMLQQMPMKRIWFIPVLLSVCEVPDRNIGGGETLRSLQWEPLYKDWGRGVTRILKAMGADKPKVFTIDQPIYLELIRIPPGEFLMGDEKQRVDVEELYIGKYPITNAQWAVFEKTEYCNLHSNLRNWQRNGFPAGRGSHPVAGMLWDDAIAFCDWLSEATGHSFRLPSEAEWEKAARGTDGREYPWGNEFDAGKCNTRESGVKDTTPVGKYSPQGDSPYGVADMAGNVWEWTNSWYDRWRRNRVLRGGSFRFDWGIHCAFRYQSAPYFDGNDDPHGFRVCVSPGP